MKSAFVYFFEDEPQFVTRCSREWLANYLRACRKQAYLHVERIAMGYAVTRSGSVAKALIVRF
jgi:hypothetical protein